MASTQMKKKLERMGITPTTSSPYIIHSNALTEIMNRALTEKAGALLEVFGLKRIY